MSLKSGCILGIFAFLLAAPAAARQAKDQGCPVPLLPPSKPKLNLFTPAQEVELGEILAEVVQDNTFQIEDQELTGDLRQIGDRLVGHLPPSDLKFRFFLSNLPFANAFSIAGGRIYVSRKLVGFVRSEDELAGVLAHEIGHILTHQTAAVLSRLLKALGVTQLGDRRDISDKFHRLLQSQKRARVDLEEQQEEADEIGLQLVTRAGYDVGATADFYDRLTDNRGRTGNWFTDIFGSTGLNSKRYRDMRKSMENLPAGCIQERSPDNSAKFKAWQAAVVSYRGTGRPERIVGLITKKALEPPLLDEIHTLRFSPDGQFLLAQDQASIYLLTVKPFAMRFRIDALDAYPAQFTWDSKSIVFYTPELRVEKWDVEQARPLDVNEVVSSKGCMQTALSPDATTLACIDFQNDLVLIDTATSERIFEKKDVRAANVGLGWGLDRFWFTYEVRFVDLGFSLDSHYFVTAGRQRTMAVDLRTRKEIPLGGPVKSLLDGGFAFLDDRRAVGRRGKGFKAAVFSFPDGNIEREIEIGGASPARVAKGEYVLLRPIRDYKVGVLDLRTNQLIRGSKTEAMDIYDEITSSTLGSGEVALFGQSATPIARAKLPRGHFGTLNVVAFSDDLRWLAASSRLRGAVWDLERGSRLYHVKGFRGAYFSADGAVFVDFPKQEQTERAIARLSLQQTSITLAQKVQNTRSFQTGPYLFSWQSGKGDSPAEKKAADEDSDDETNYRYEGTHFHWRDVLQMPRENETLEVRDAVGASVLWTKRFPKTVPRAFVNAGAGVVAFGSRYGAPGVQEELSSIPGLVKPESGAKEDDYFIEVVDLRNGKAVGGVIVSTGGGSFTVVRVLADSQWVAFQDSFGRTQVYSLKTGKLSGRAFGKPLAVTSQAGKILIQYGEGRLGIYDLPTFERQEELSFPHRVSGSQFSNDGKKLLVLTSDQVVYMIDPSAHQESNKRAAATLPHP